MPAIQIATSEKVDVNFGLGFTEYGATFSRGVNSAAFTIRAGFDIHKPAEHQKIMLRHNKTVDSGLHLSVECDKLFKGQFHGGTPAC